MEYSRNNPSPRFKLLLEQYTDMHLQGEKRLGLPPEETFPGKSLPAQALRIKRLIELTQAETILDYGSGKGKQYDPIPFVIKGEGEWPSIIEYWDISEVTCYDPSYAPFSKLPEGKFDGVICTDVLEHCPEEDIHWIVNELFEYANKFVFANVACYPARKHLPNGENAHCTIKPVEWWKELLESIASRHAGIAWEIWLQYQAQTPSGIQLLEKRIGSESQ